MCTVLVYFFIEIFIRSNYCLCMNCRPWKILSHITDETYKQVTREVFRADHRTLSLMPVDKFTELNEWEKNMQLHSTRHFFEERLKPYLNRWSRNGKYIELYPAELVEILSTDLKQKILDRQAILVELGFNETHEICKAAYVFPLTTRRFLFFCIGMDSGIKTAYITPMYKFRANYQGMRYLTVEEALRLGPPQVPT